MDRDEQFPGLKGFVERINKRHEDLEASISKLKSVRDAHERYARQHLGSRRMVSVLRGLGYALLAQNYQAQIDVLEARKDLERRR